MNCATGTSRFKQVLLDTTAHSKTIFSNPAKTFVALTAGGPSISKKLKQLLELEDDLNLRVRVIVNEIKQLRVRYIEFEGAEKKWPIEPVFCGNVHITLKVAQSKVKTAIKILNKQIKIFNALIAGGSNISKKLKPLIIKGKINPRISAVVNEIKQLRIDYIKFKGIEEDWPSEPVVGDVVHITLKEAQEKLNSVRKIYNKESRIFDALIIGEPIISTKLQPLFNLKGSEKFKQAIPAIVNEIKRLRTRYIELKGTKKNWPPEPVVGDVVYITLKEAQDKLKFIKTYNKQANVFDDLVADNPAPRFEDEDIIITREDNWKSKRLNIAINNIIDKINCLEKLYRHYSGIAKGANNDEWPENTVNTDDNVGRDYPTLETAQTTVTSAKTIYDRKAKVFDALVVNNPEEILSDKQSTINRDDKWNLPTLNAKITTIIHEIKRLRVFYINLGGSKSVWNVEPVVGNTVNFTLKEAQNELNDIQATYRERVKVFNALIAGNPADNFEGKKTTITLEKSWNLEKLNEAISNIIAEITHLESLYHQYSGTIKGADNDEWPENDYLTLETAQTTVKSVKTTYDRRTKVFDDLIVEKPADTFEGETTIIVRVNTWNLEELNKAISDIITEIKRLEGLYRQYSGTIKGVNNDEWPENTVNIDDTPKNDYPILKAVQNKVTTAKKLYKERAKVFDDLVAGKPVAIFEGRPLIIIRDDKWNLLTLNTKITAITTEITRLKKKFDKNGDSNLWAGSLLENKPNLAEAQVLIKILEFKEMYGDYNLDSVPVSTDAFWANDEIITPDLFFTDKSPPMVTTVEVEKQIKSLQKEIKRTKITHLLLGGEAWTEEKTFVQVRKLTKNTVEIIKPDIQESANDMVKIDDIIKKYFSERGKTINKQTKAKLLQAILFQKVGVFSVNNDGMKWETIVAIFLGIFSIILVGIIFYFFKKPKIV